MNKYHINNLLNIIVDELIERNEHDLAKEINKLRGKIFEKIVR